MSAARSGKFICFEGGEGVGKSTCLRYAAEYLQSQGYAVRCTREPGGTPVGERLRAIFLDPALGQDISAMTELLMVFAARAQHLTQVIEPALARGEWVLCDRFTDATYAYQGAGRGVATQHIDALVGMVQQGRRPDRTVLLDAPLSVGMERARARAALDRMEQQQQAFFESMLACYRARAAASPEHYCVLDASQPLERVQQALVRDLQVWLS